MNYNVAIQRLKMPARMLKLPVDDRGFPVPRFVKWIDGKPDFRVIDTAYMRRAFQQKLCWLCGEQLGRHLAFVIGPMCAINRVTSEPPCHLGCARFACEACPFLTQPKRGRNSHDLPADAEQPAGIMVERNPGVSAIWVTDSYRTFKAKVGTTGVLIQIGDATDIEWWSHGRRATRDEIIESIETGIPALHEIAHKEGPEAVAALYDQIARGMARVPKDDPRVAEPAHPSDA